jgi:hypothetical protein
VIAYAQYAFVLACHANHINEPYQFFRVGIDSQASSLMDSVFADCMSVGCQLLAAEKCTLALNAFQCEPQEFGLY